MLTGLARDGGLYVARSVAAALGPRSSPDSSAGPYWEVAVDVIRPFGRGRDFRRRSRAAWPTRAYATFPPSGGGAAQSDEPQSIRAGTVSTARPLAFKDVAMQLISRLMDHVLAKARGSAPPNRGRDPRAITGGGRGRCVRALPTMSISSCCSRTAEISDVQRRMMTTTGRQQTFTRLAIEGTFRRLARRS